MYFRKNPYHKRAERGSGRRRAIDKVLQENLLRAIPENYVDLYPAVRLRTRKFVFHIGPTNSGKTYSAMQALRSAGSGAYLGPLRLLAYEQFEAMNTDGYPCSLWTGEERIEIYGSPFTSSTIEMADYSAHYKLVVIDEAQMIADEDRGGAWTSALLGIDADEIHVCASGDAEMILCRIAKDCKDEYEVLYHERQTPLIPEEKGLNFPKRIEKGDAVIVFSRRNVHAVAAGLQRKGYKTSIIYGALPYDVRHEEARKFNMGETDVVVATDAIGMGLNMPIRRVVFLEARKFDGKDDRALLPHEVKQIAGRAGRYGIYEAGFVTGDRPVFKAIMKQFSGRDEVIESAAIAFPEQLIGMNARLSEIMRKWKETAVHQGYIKANVDREISLAEKLEAKTDNKKLIYEMITVPFDEGEAVLMDIWLDLCDTYIEGGGVDAGRHLPKSSVPSEDPDALRILERQYRICDLLYFFSDRFGAGEEEMESIVKRKASISRQMMKILRKQRLVGRTCRYCGRELAWNHPYGICKQCYDRIYVNRY